tara:strand:+ start:2210 stop:4342 length:2133 start_codon:yes stop_codon:yes gene_type:complete
MAISKINTPEIFDLGATNTSLKLPSGDTASRPTSPSTGQWRYNTDLKYVEYYDGSNWQQIDIEEECTTNTVNFPSGTTASAYYKLDYSARDESSNNYDGTENNITYVNGSPYSQAAVFNGSNSAIVLPNNILTSNFSISIWFNLDSNTGLRTLLEFDYENRVIFRTSSTDSNLAYIGSVGYFDPGISFSTGQWYHLVITFSNGNPFKFYVNGVLSYTGANSTINAQNNDNILGAANSSGSGAQDGKIDQVRIYSSELDSDQVLELYNEVQCPCTTNTIGYSVDAIGSTTNTSTEAYYKLDGNAYDATANANNGTWGGTESYSDAPYGIGGVFNGTSSYIDTGIGGSVLGELFSVSVWFKTSTTSTYQTIFDNGGNTSGESGFTLVIGTDNILKARFSNSDGVSVFDLSTGTTVTDGNWHHCALTYNNESAKIYLDNGTPNTGTNTKAFSQASNNLRIGAYILDGTLLEFNGDLDQIRIYSSEIDSDQVSQLYNEVYCNTISTLDVFGDSSGVALYQFNNSATSTDSSTNNGTWYGTEAYVGGYFGSAASFDGNSSYVRTPLDFDSAALNNYTISLWIKVAASPASNTVFAGTIDSAAKNGIYLSINTTDTIRFFERDNGGTVTTLESTDTINIGEWNHIVAVRQYGTNFLYINNGTAVSASNDSSFNHAIDFTIGRSGDYSTSELNGEIDQVRILRKGVSAFEVTQLFSE